MDKIELMVSASGKGTATTASIGNHKIIIDADKNIGPNPLETLLSALAACENGTANVVAKEMNFDLQGITFKITGELDSRGFMGDSNVRTYFEKVEVVATVKTTESEERLKELQHVVESRCPLYGLFKAANVQMTEHWLKAD
ncbi:OsmC family protein [Oceanobacillus sp. FSL K6-2867]|uniref:OsmC family protein n=1 Tax=Oceanobacillus sp. FSL K6-2867 TaxID=2954748 RepID=UPI0030DDB395